MTRTMTLLIIFLISFTITQGQEIIGKWEQIKGVVENMTDSTTYDQIVKSLGKPSDEFATPSLLEEYVLYFDIPNEPGYMYWIMLDTENKTFLYWGDEKQKKNE